MTQVADSQRSADVAARTALVEYDTDDIDSPILTVEDAVEKSSFIKISPFLYPKQVGDFSKGMAEADDKIFSAEVFCISLLFTSVIMVSRVGNISFLNNNLGFKMR